MFDDDDEPSGCTKILQYMTFYLFPYFKKSNKDY